MTKTHLRDPELALFCRHLGRPAQYISTASNYKVNKNLAAEGALQVCMGTTLPTLIGNTRYAITRLITRPTSKTIPDSGSFKRGSQNKSILSKSV